WCLADHAGAAVMQGLAPWDPSSTSSMSALAGRTGAAGGLWYELVLEPPRWALPVAMVSGRPRRGCCNAGACSLGPVEHQLDERVSRQHGCRRLALVRAGARTSQVGAASSDGVWPTTPGLL